MTAPLFRILSDIHYGDHASLVRSPEALQPLFEGVGTVIFNGDTFETRAGPHVAELRAGREAFLAFCRDQPVPVRFVTGNHDPLFSPHHYLDLADGQVFVTHGDILFDSIAPWDRNVREVSRLYQAELARLPARLRHDFDALLGACKAASNALPAHPEPFLRGAIGRALCLAARTCPPWRIFHMMRAWHELPARVADLTRRHRPAARFTIVGHTHLPGVWKRNGVTVINTGSYLPPLGRQIVDLERDAVVVRSVICRNGRFYPGTVRTRRALAAAGRAAIPAGVTVGCR